MHSPEAAMVKEQRDHSGILFCSRGAVQGYGEGLRRLLTSDCCVWARVWLEKLSAGFKTFGCEGEGKREDEMEVR